MNEIRLIIIEKHLAVRQAVNLQVMDILRELGLQIAFPTRTMHLTTDDPLKVQAAQE